MLIGLTTTPPAAGQTDAVGPRDTPTAEQLQARIAGLEGATGTDEAARARLLELYRLALDRVGAAQAYANTAAEYQRAAAEAPERIRRLQQRTAAPPPALPAGQTALAEASLEELKQVLTRDKASLTAMQGKLADLQEQLSALQARPLRARQELAEARSRRESLEQELRAPPVAGEDARIREAREALLLAQRSATDQEIRMLEQELLSLDARQALLELERSVAAERTERQSARVRELEALANRRSLAEAAEVVESAQQAVSEPAGVPPLIQETAAENARLSEQLSALVAEIETAGRHQQIVEQQLERLQSRYRSTQQQLEIAGLSAALGEILRRESRSLPDPERYARRVDERQSAIAEARLRQFQLDEQRPTPETIEQQASALMRERLPELPPEAAPDTAARLRQLLTDRAALQDKLSINYGRIVDQLLALNRDEQQLVTQLRRYSELLDESLFWIASARPLSLAWLSDLGRSAAWLFDGSRWRAAADALLAGVSARPLASAGFLLLALLLLRGRPRLRAQLLSIAGRVGGPEDRFDLSLNALLDTVLLALVWPLLIGAAGWLMTQGAADDPFAYAVGRALLAVASVALSIEAFRQLCRDSGVAQTHFNWRARSRRVLRRNLSWLLAVSLPLTFVIGLTEWQPEELHRDSLGRLAFLLGSMAIAAFAWRALRPGVRLVTGLRRERRRGWWRLRRGVRPLAVVAPLVLAGLALYGYYYTALQLESRLFSTGWLLIGTGILANLGLRWMRLAERRLAQRERLRQQTAPAPTRLGRSRAELDLRRIDEQSRTLLQVALGLAITFGLWLIWADLLPALNILENVVLWQRESAAGERLPPVSLEEIALALLAVALTLIAARNLPGLLEISLLSRLDVDAGDRYAITSISRYLIVATGLLLAINLIGVDWGQAQWLIAALGVGLGFGLQEIFANFVSGLILLFERPIRVGDTVSIGPLTGQVAKIHIRATTITDAERREIIIPNKSFITDQLINWTLSDQVTRVTLKLEVAFGSPPDRLQAMLLQAAASNPRVMRVPEPFAYFVGIGEGALRFELNVFVSALEDRLPVAHELYAEISARLQAMGVEIPYPQRDLHIRSIDPSIDPSRRPPQVP